MKFEKVTGWTPKFKEQLSSIEIYGIEAMVKEMNEDETFHYTPETLGLAYTSSSDYGMLNICNGQFDFEDADISHFAVTKNGRLFLVGYEGEDENEVFFEAGSY